MEDEVKEGGSVLKRPRPREDDPKETLPNSAAAASGTNAEVRAKRPLVDPKPVSVSSLNAAGIKYDVLRPSVETGWTWLPFDHDGPPFPEMDPEEDDYINESDCIFGVEDGRLVLVGRVPNSPPDTPSSQDPVEHHPCAITYDMYFRRKAELKGKNLTLDDPLFTTRICPELHPFPFLPGFPTGTRVNLPEDLYAARAAAAAAGSSSLIKGSPEADSSASLASECGELQEYYRAGKMFKH